MNQIYSDRGFVSRNSFTHLVSRSVIRRFRSIDIAINLRENNFIDDVHEAVAGLDVSFDDLRTLIFGVARTLLKDMFVRAHCSCVSTVGHFGFLGARQVLKCDFSVRHHVSLQYESNVNVAGDAGGLIEGGIRGNKDGPQSLVQVVNEIVLGQEGTNDGEVTVRTGKFGF
jgi:hypothetical protein